MAEAADIQGTTAAPVRRWLRRPAALVTSIPLLAALLQTSALAPAQAADRTGDRTAELSVTRITPTVPAPGDTLTLSGKVTNKGSSTITDARLALRLGPALNSRSAIRHALRRTGYSPGLDGSEVDSGQAVELKDLAPGMSRSYTLELPVDKLKLPKEGVYQVGVALNGQTKNRSYEQVLGMQRTVLPWQPSSGGQKTELTFLWPLVSSSHLTARTDADEEQTPVFHDDALLDELKPGGRLQQMVALGDGLPVTWVIDPDLLASAEAMTRSYRVQTDDGKTAPGKNQEYARQWLNSLIEAVQDDEVVALPFADPDVASLAHRGKNVSGALGHLGPATDLARTTVETVLHVEPSTDFAWPVHGAVDAPIVSVATSAGARNIIARSDSLQEERSLTYTPTAARPIGGGTTAVVADVGLSRMFEGDLTRADRASLATQRFVAQTLSITNQVPNRQRSIVVAPQRRPSASQARSMAETLTALQDNPNWVQFADLTEAASAEPDPRANRTVPDGGAYPRKLRAQELPTRAFEQMRETHSTLEDFTVILTREDRVETPVGNAIRREMSTSWREHPGEAAAYRESVQHYLIGLTQKVRLIKKSPITLSGRSATIPVTVQNNLVQAVDGLELRLTSSRRLGLDVDEPQAVTVAGGHSQSVKFTASAKANGRAYLEAQLYTEDGEPYGAPMTFQANVTEITSTVLLVIAVGVLLVVLAGIRMYTQRKRRGTAAAPDDRDGPEPEPTEAEHHTRVPAGDGSDALVEAVTERSRAAERHAAGGSTGTPDTGDPDSADHEVGTERTDGEPESHTAAPAREPAPAPAGERAPAREQHTDRRSAPQEQPGDEDGRTPPGSGVPSAPSEKVDR